MITSLCQGDINLAIREEDFIWFTGDSPSLKEAKAGIETETMEEACILTCFLWLTHPAFTQEWLTV